MEKIRQFLENGKWKQLKKSDWIVAALVGVLIMIIALPDGSNSPASGWMNEAQKSEAKNQPGSKEETDYERQESGQDIDAYTDRMEEKLEKVLSQMDGVGEVEVMITVSDKGEQVVEKDRMSTTTTTSETDSGGGVRTVTESTGEEAAVYVETGNETSPYIQKEKFPEIVGIMVVAEGGGNSVVVSDISDAVKALFPVEAHRIKVVKMCSREE